MGYIFDGCVIWETLLQYLFRTHENVLHGKHCAKAIFVRVYGSKFLKYFDWSGYISSELCWCMMTSICFYAFRQKIIINAAIWPWFIAVLCIQNILAVCKTNFICYDN